MSSAWQMNKLGFVNFWLYDREEFPFCNGRLLLRGENGAGKSVTTQSFVPFMLDGDLHPYRLDSFGSKDRKMDYYLLGEDKEENTGYLYLEFAKPDPGLYRTLVVGLRARRGKPLDFWGFCLSDGRRIGTGQGDFSLFVTRGAQHISLTKQEAHNRFGDGENWVERSGEYKQMVNRVLFGCEELEQYDRLLKLLIQIRKPKLSKDFSPELVRTTLNESLQPLGEDDIAPMVNSMQKMDDIQTRLDNLRESLRAARQLRNEYKRYNSFVLGKKGRIYLEKHQQADKLRLEVQQDEDAVAACEEGLALAQQRFLAANQNQGELQRQLDALEGYEDLKSKAQRLAQLREQQSADAQALEHERAVEKRKQDSLQDQERKLSWKKRDIEGEEAVLQGDFEQLQQLNARLQYPGHPQSLLQLDRSAGQEALNLFYNRLHKARGLLEASEEARDELDDQQKKHSEADAELRHAKSELRRAEATAGRMKDELCEAFAALEDPNLPFHLAGEDVQQLLQLVSSYEGMIQDQAIARILGERKDALARPLHARLAELKQASARLQSELNELKAQKDGLEKQHELPPPRAEAVQRTRALLREQGIPHAAFYELVDFDPALPAQGRAMLEAQLQDAGLLDALVLPDPDSARVAGLLQQHPDHFLCLDEASPAPQPLPLRAEPGAPAWADVGGILQKLSALPQGQVYFAADGVYRQGAIQGRSAPQKEAAYIGASARKANRERQLAALDEQLQAKGGELQENARRSNEAAADLQRLSDSYQQCPTTADIAAGLQLVAEQQMAVDRRERVWEEYQLRVQTMQNKVNRLRSQYLPLVQQFPYDQTAAAYGDMLERCSEYRGQLERLAGGLGRLELQKSEKDALEGQIDQLNDDLLDQTERVRRAEARLRQTGAAIGSLQEYLDRPENQALSQTLERLNQALEAARRERDAANEKQIICSTELENKRPALATKKQQWADAIAQDEHMRAIFEEELCQGPGQPGLGEGSLAEQARRAWEAVRQNDRALTHENLRASLEKNLGGAAALSVYRIALEPLFASEEGILRNRARIVLYAGGKKQDLLDFIAGIESQIAADEQLLFAEDRLLFETILNQTVTTKLSHRINDSQVWVARMSETMQQLTTSMGLHFGLKWKGKPADQQDELATGELVALLRKDPAVMGDADRARIAAHFRARVNKARELARREEGQYATYSELMRQALDFRNWFEFRLYFSGASSGRRT